MSEASDHSQKYRPANDKRPPYQVSAREVVGALNRQVWGGVNTFTSYYRWNAFPAEAKRAINAEIGRTITLVREGHSAADIALLYPSDALMVGFEPVSRGAGGAAAKRTAALFKDAGRTLFEANRSFLIVDGDALAAAKVEDGRLVHGKLRWRTVVLAGASVLPVAAARNLAALQRAGGHVIVLGDVPANSEVRFPDDEVRQLAADWTFLAADRASALADVLARRHPPALRVVRGPQGALRTSHRRTPDGDVFFVMNDLGRDWQGAVRLAQDVPARTWDPRSGTFADHPAGEIALALPPYAGVVITTPQAVESPCADGL